MTFDPTDDQEELSPDTQPDAVDEQTTVRDDSAEEVVEKASKAARKLEPIVLAHVHGPKYQPVKPRVIARQLKLPSEQHNALKLAIRRLAKAGKLAYGAGHLVRPLRPKTEPQKSHGNSGSLTPPLSRRDRDKKSAGTAPLRENKNV